MTISNLVISHLGFEGWNWDLIASGPDFCILFTFRVPSKFVTDLLKTHSTSGVVFHCQCQHFDSSVM